jgi:hypothetical protein
MSNTSERIFGGAIEEASKENKYKRNNVNEYLEIP